MKIYYVKMLFLSLLVASPSLVLSFLSPNLLQPSHVSTLKSHYGNPATPKLGMSNTVNEVETASWDDNKTLASATPVANTGTDSLVFPFSLKEMVQQASSAMEDGYNAGKNRQILRLLLPRSSTNDQLLQYYENDADSEYSLGDSVILVPPDETWQGGIMQLYRAASLACQELLRRYSRNANGGVIPRLIEDRSVDESGVDGIGLWMTQSAASSSGAADGNTMYCFVQPSQETIPSIETLSQADDNKERLVVLMNPQWRIADDALDKASRETGFFGSLASFLGGKGMSLRKLEDDLRYENIYVVEGYVCRGGNVRLMKRFDSDWVVFAENDAATDYVKVGSCKTRPTYQQVDAMLQDLGISLKYARDIGLAPKL